LTRDERKERPHGKKRQAAGEEAGGKIERWICESDPRRRRQRRRARLEIHADTRRAHRLELKKLRPWNPADPAGEYFAVDLEIGE
jgi:hypothetical protein